MQDHQIHFKKSVRTTDRAIYEAAYNGDRETCKTLYAASATPLNLNFMMYYAARGGQKEICDLIYEWITPYSSYLKRPVCPDNLELDIMLGGAARVRDPVKARQMCELAREYASRAIFSSSHNALGNLDYRFMIYAAAKRGNRELCVLAHDWGCQNYNMMLRGAAAGRDEQQGFELCQLAREWDACDSHPNGGLDYEYMLWGAIVAGNLELCKLACSYGAKVTHSMASAHRRRFSRAVTDFIENMILTGNRLSSCSVKRMI